MSSLEQIEYKHFEESNSIVHYEIECCCASLQYMARIYFAPSGWLKIIFLMWLKSDFKNLFGKTRSKVFLHMSCQKDHFIYNLKIKKISIPQCFGMVWGWESEIFYKWSYICLETTILLYKSWIRFTLWKTHFEW